MFSEVAGHGSSPMASIVVVCYNQARYLVQAIESARAQTVQDLEILVVDDGSTDETRAVCERFADVRYIYQSNRG
ncbi:MAG TPA: glycosyltransferase, partial [Bryobacteraceae bacterium]